MIFGCRHCMVSFSTVNKKQEVLEKRGKRKNRKKKKSNVRVPPPTWFLDGSHKFHKEDLPRNSAREFRRGVVDRDFLSRHLRGWFSRPRWLCSRGNGLSRRGRMLSCRLRGRGGGFCREGLVLFLFSFFLFFPSVQVGRDFLFLFLLAPWLEFLPTWTSMRPRERRLATATTWFFSLIRWDRICGVTTSFSGG